MHDHAWSCITAIPATPCTTLCQARSRSKSHRPPIRLKEGQYFGEIALLKDIERTAMVITNKDCQLLSLRSTDFRNLMKRQPNISEKITQQADGRLQELEIGHGDTRHLR